MSHNDTKEILESIAFTPAMLRIVGRASSLLAGRAVPAAAPAAWRAGAAAAPSQPQAWWWLSSSKAGVFGPLAQAERGMASKRHKEVLRQTTGYKGRAKNCFRVAVRRLQKALQHAYRDRKQKKRDMRTLWIQRVGAATRQHGMRYSQLIPGLGRAGVVLNRKVLSDLAATEPYSFRAVMDTVKSVPRP
jgi:large subunit ribosomal protein L20